jgi:hypothetical protein
MQGTYSRAAGFAPDLICGVAQPRQASRDRRAIDRMSARINEMRARINEMRAGINEMRAGIDTHSRLGGRFDGLPPGERLL